MRDKGRKRKERQKGKIAEMEDFIERKTDTAVDQKTIAKLTNGINNLKRVIPSLLPRKD